jgi:hypothetical protein
MENVLFLVKLLAGGAVLAVGLLVLFFIFIFIRSEWHSRKLTAKQGFKKLKLPIHVVLYLSVALGILALFYFFPLGGFSFWGIWFVFRGHKTIYLFGNPTKGRSLTRQRMEALRKENGNFKEAVPMALQERKEKNKRHRQAFLNRLAKR